MAIVTPVPDGTSFESLTVDGDERQGVASFEQRASFRRDLISSGAALVAGDVVGGPTGGRFVWTSLAQRALSVRVFDAAGALDPAEFEVWFVSATSDVNPTMPAESSPMARDGNWSEVIVVPKGGWESAIGAGDGGLYKTYRKNVDLLLQAPGLAGWDIRLVTTTGISAATDIYVQFDGVALTPRPASALS